MEDTTTEHWIAKYLTTLYKVVVCTDLSTLFANFTLFWISKVNRRDGYAHQFALLFPHWHSGTVLVVCPP